MSLEQPQTVTANPPTAQEDWHPVIKRMDADLRRLLISYAQSHLAQAQWELDEHPVPHYDPAGQVTAVEWRLTYQGKYSGRKTVGVTLLLRRRTWGPLDAVGFQITGTSGRSQAQPTLQDVAAALAESKPLDAPSA
jgi:hypothetical protein